MRENIPRQDISTLFKAVGIDKKGTVIISENMYGFDAEKPKDSWFYATLLGFLEFKKRWGNIDSYASIDASAAIDAIGANEILGAKKIVVTDFHPEVPGTAVANVKKNVPVGVEVSGCVGYWCEPLIERVLKFDLIFANIPNIPTNDSTYSGIKGASYFDKKKVVNCALKFEKYLLASQFLFLQQAKRILNKGGSVISAVGGRVPYEILKQMFVESGYEFNELVSVFKIQTQPDDVLEGYAEAEQKYGVEFDFYRYEEAQTHWLEIENKNLSGPELKEELKKYKVSATKAYNEYLNAGKNFGHVVHILCGK